MNLAPAFPWRTDRAELFLLEPAHVSPAYLAWLSDTEVMRYMESRFSAHDLATTAAFVRSARLNADVLMLGIRSAVLGRHVGNIKLGPVDRHHGLGDVGIMIGDREAWGRGLGTDAIRIVVAIAARQLGLRKVTAGCYVSNVASRRAFEKAGFFVEATRPDHYLLDGRAEGLVMMAKFIDGQQAQEGFG